MAYDRAYAPFGEPYAETATTNRDFTGQTEDTTPGLYDFLFRQQSQSQGRWLVPDPVGLAAVDITNPQTWNRYAYVANNPLNAIDPLGLCNGGDPGGIQPAMPIGCPIPPSPPGSPPPPPPPPSPPPQPIHFPDETLGIPNGLNLNWGGIWGAIIPSGNCADMGPCNPIGIGYTDASTLPVVLGGVARGIALVWSATAAAVVLLLVQTGDAAPRSYPRNPGDLVAKGCTPGAIISEPSRTYPGGTSHEQMYTCPDGSKWTVHWIDLEGRNVHGPHIRPGAPKGGGEW